LDHEIILTNQAFKHFCHLPSNGATPTFSHVDAVFGYLFMLMGLIAKAQISQANLFEAPSMRIEI
jgi:hypothetical protein